MRIRSSDVHVLERGTYSCRPSPAMLLRHIGWALNPIPVTPALSPHWHCTPSRHLQRALKRYGVPYVLVRDTSLFERAEVQDALAYLRWPAGGHGAGEGMRSVGEDLPQMHRLAAGCWPGLHPKP
jgi:hypothetical protein